MADVSADRRIFHTWLVRGAFSRTRQSCCMLAPFRLVDELAVQHRGQAPAVDLHPREGGGASQAQECVGVDGVAIFEIPHRKVVAEGQGKAPAGVHGQELSQPAPRRACPGAPGGYRPPGRPSRCPPRPWPIFEVPGTFPSALWGAWSVAIMNRYTYRLPGRTYPAKVGSS